MTLFQIKLPSYILDMQLQRQNTGHPLATLSRFNCVEELKMHLMEGRSADLPGASKRASCVSLITQG